MKYFDKTETAKVKVLVNGDKVSVLLPTVSDKLLFQWRGPAVITDRRGLVNYRVRFESGEEKIFHINMLKKYNEREDSDEVAANMPVVNSGQFTNNEETRRDDRVLHTFQSLVDQVSTMVQMWMSKELTVWKQE